MKPPHPPHLEFVSKVTRKHARRFAEKWYFEAEAAPEISEPFDAAGIVTFPDEDDHEAVERFLAIEHEIVSAAFLMVKDAVADAFFKAATEVLAREREK